MSSTLLKLALPALAVVLAGAVQAEEFTTKDVKIKVDVVASGLENPWAVEVLPDGAYIVTERPGRLRIIRDGTLSEPITGLPEIAVRGQGGLLDVALSPDFAKDRTIFLTAALAYDGGAGTGVIRARLSEDERALTYVKTIFRMRKVGTTGRHFGSRIAFGTDGTLHFAIGDRGNMKRGQDFFDHAAAIMRINPDGSVPKDNPFADGSKALPEIFSKGHRNAQGLVFDPLTSGMITAEHGAQGGDEINLPKAGLNYGWARITYGKNYNGRKIGVGVSAPGLEQPAHYWDPSIAPGALVVYSGKMFPEWKNDILVTSLKFGLISRLDRDATGKVTSEERFIDNEFGRLRDIIMAPDGSLLVTTDEADGQLLRISRAGDAS
ncbi:PQQ-dependent sugar dehydrogenase [Rhizobium sp. TH2]|uniref:PQQ-dependent sugar dehydrogenase n=1 Tax=Rhizobium sp. TH2 TaxID=2775403 RepID=UPI002157FC92|nr:PQQ-dependent sugar dehydrogenase [Rhizobium sp. TH2]UVC07034.1 PQQ-dependent sugar dehydrogenase [Rhizobium sp. TH2]